MQALFAVNSTARLLWPCLADFRTPFRWRLPSTIVAHRQTAKDRHAVHVHNQLKTPPHTTPRRALAREVHARSVTHLQQTIFHFYLIDHKFVTSSVHMTYMLKLEGEC